MSINNKQFVADEEIDHVKLNEISDDANNSINNIHPQYAVPQFQLKGSFIYMRDNAGTPLYYKIKSIDDGTTTFMESIRDVCLPPTIFTTQTLIDNILSLNFTKQNYNTNLRTKGNLIGYNTGTLYIKIFVDNVYDSGRSAALSISAGTATLNNAIDISGLTNGQNIQVNYLLEIATDGGAGGGYVGWRDPIVYLD